MFPSSGYVSSGSSGSGGGAPPPDLTGYVTSSSLNAALALKADASALSNFATSVFDSLNALTVSSSVSFQTADVGFTVNQLDKIYVIHSTGNDTAARLVSLNFTYDQLGNGTVLVYNASRTTPLRIQGDGDSPFFTATQSQIYFLDASFDIPVGRWMGITRTDSTTSGQTVSGGLIPAASYRISLS
jgi:hypothetical protein